MSLEQFCADLLGARVNLNTKVFVAARPMVTGLRENLPRCAKRQFDGFMQRAGLTRPRLRKSALEIKDFTDWRRPPAPRRGELEEELFNLWATARREYASGRPRTGAAIAQAIKGRLGTTSRVFAERLHIHCDALLVDATDLSDKFAVEAACDTARRNTARYLAQHDSLSAGISLLSEAQLHRAWALLEPEKEHELIRYALSLGNFASAAICREHSECDADVLAFLRFEAMFQRSRLLQESGALADALRELPRLRNEALQLGTGLAQLEYARAEASLYMATGIADRSGQAIANGCWLYENIDLRPGVTMLSFLGRMLDLYQRVNKKAKIENLNAFSDTRSGKPPDEFTETWLGRIKQTYATGRRWDEVCGPACYFARISSLYLEPKLSRL